MAISFVQSAVNATGSGTSLIVTLGGAATVQNFFVLHMKFGANVTNISVTDNSGGSNAYAKALEQFSGSIDAYQFYGVQTTGGATTVTISWTTATSARIIVDEYSGGSITNATLFDKVAANTGTDTSGTVPISPTNAGELIAVGYLFGTAGTFAAGTNYTAAQSGTNASSQYRLVGTTSETAPASWTNSVAWIGIAGAYRPYSTPPSGGANIGGTRPVIIGGQQQKHIRAYIARHNAASLVGNTRESWKNYLLSAGGVGKTFSELETSWLASLGYATANEYAASLGYTGGSPRENIRALLLNG